MLDTYRVLVTAAPESLDAALAELKFDKYEIASTVLGDGVALVELEQPLDEWRTAIERRPPVFVRHLAPVQREIMLDQRASDLERLAKVAVGLAEHLPDAPFAIQTRLLDEHPQFARFEINEQLATAVQNAVKLPLDVRNPVGVISLTINRDRAYMGVSDVSFNRSTWTGGAQRFAREQGQLSRAEFKLLEAQAVFDFDFPEHGQALDLGAAPGGWTRILRRAGLPVVAVDPAELHPILRRDPQVRHLQTLAQRFLPTSERFSVIVNDIRLDARDSAWLMNEAADALEDDGIAVVTLKLPHEHFAKITYHALSILRQRYEIIGARQLFHNRSEVTVVMRKGQPSPKPKSRSVKSR